MTTDNQRLPDEELKALWRQMTLIRAFEGRVEELFKQGRIRGTAHSCIGQEATAAAVCARLRRDDYVASYHRGHGHCLAKGADPGRMMAELFGASDGYCGGLGGSMHIADLGLGIIGANGIVGASLPLGVGAALASKIRRDGRVAVAFFGDGSTNEGVFHEALNLASIWKLPVIFFCENNQYALTASFSEMMSCERVVDRAAAYRIPGQRVDGNDVAEVTAAIDEAIARARDGEGPSFIEALTYRWGQHSMRANLREPRPPEEIAQWKARDPIARARRELIERGALDDAAAAEMETQAASAVERAIDFGAASPPPTAEFMLSAVYAPRADVAEVRLTGERALSYAEAVAEAMRQEMERDAKVIVLGEDVGLTGGIFQATRGLCERFGPERVRDTPISEAAIVGAAVGAALAGLRPIVEIQFFDFVTLAMDAIVNQAAKLRFMLGGAGSVPLVVRGPQGGGIRVGAQHSQSLEAWFTHIPGLVVIAPSTPYDAKGLLTSAIRDDNPVVFLEHKLLYAAPPSPVPEESYAIPIGKGEIKRAGRDLTIVATMAMVARALSAAAALERQGISAEVIDPRTLAPLDEDLILASVRKTNRLLIVHEAWPYGGFAAELCARVVEKAFDWLDAPIARVCALPVPMPYNGELERLVIPSADAIAEAAVKLMA
jgi:2-oxoisovalerate dehydrogenase E1 component